MKDTIRRQVLDARLKLSPGERRAGSDEIEARLFGLPEFKAAKAILFFASFRSEVDTHHMIRRALAEGKRVVLPKVKGKGLELFEISDFGKDVHPGSWGIPEPAGPGARPADLSDIGLIIVPGAAFDRRGNRIGYGAGFYDKLLAAYHGMTVAVAFDLQIVSGVPTDQHDVAVKKIVTDKRVIETKS